MKITKLITTSIIGVSAFFLLTSGNLNTLNANGTAGSTGAPGESHTCSQAGCHGAGNGTGTSGGLTDNTGPGSITISSIPIMTGNTYIPGTTYSMIITVSETGKTNFGFDAEILDNSGNTDLHINNTSGTITITNPTKTHIVQAFGTGRATVTHSTNAGLSANTATFGFNWKAPSSGTVNLWVSGTACNNDNLPNAQDNVYTSHVIVTPNTGVGINETNIEESLNIFPNPVKDKLAISFNCNENQLSNISIISISGKIIKSFSQENNNTNIFQNTYDISNIPAGIYFVKITTTNDIITKKITII